MPDRRELPNGWKWLEDEDSEAVEDVILSLLRFRRQCFAFRGEPCWYPTRQATIARVHPEPSGSGYELAMLEQFYQFAGPLLSEQERAVGETAFGKMLLMRHHGGPTRLLDWTASPYVALYHACRAEPGEDAFVWAFALHELAEGLGPSRARELAEFGSVDRLLKLFEEDEEPWVTVVRNARQTPRMLAQQTLVSIASPADADHCEMIGAALEKSEMGGLVLRIGSRLKEDLMHHLDAMNVTGTSLYPSLDGIGQRMADAIAWKIPMMSRPGL